MRQPPDRRGRSEVVTPQTGPHVESPPKATDTDTVTRQREPVPLWETFGELLALSDERDSWMRQLLAAERDSYRRGLADGITLGRRLEAAERDRAWNEIARPIARIDPAFMSRRWALRGEPRTRETFRQPHPGDYQGRERAS